jgi:hypothetical protein
VSLYLDRGTSLTLSAGFSLVALLRKRCARESRLKQRTAHEGGSSGPPDLALFEKGDTYDEREKRENAPCGARELE